MVLPRPTSSAISRLTRGICTARTSGIELVVLDLDAAAKGRLQGAHVGRGDRAPAHGVEKGIQPLGRVEAGRLRQLDLLADLGARLQLPDDLQALAQRVILDGGEGDQVLGAVSAGQRGGRQRAGQDVGDDVAPLPHA